jgi:hypothetical protein
MPTHLASGGEGREELGEILARFCACMAQVSLFSFFLSNFQTRLGWGGTRCSAGHLAWHRWLGFREKAFSPRKKKEGKEKKNPHEMMVLRKARQGFKFDLLGLNGF